MEGGRVRREAIGKFSSGSPPRVRESSLTGSYRRANTATPLACQKLEKIAYNLTMLGRRQFLSTSLSAAAASSIAAWRLARPSSSPTGKGTCCASLRPPVYELAASIPGLSGVEVQTTRSNLWDHETVMKNR